MDGHRLLIVNADDFGLSPGVNVGVVQAYERGVVSSTSLMVRAPFGEHAARLADAQPALGLGLHVDIGEWRFEGGRWVPVYERVSQDDGDAVATEVQAQLAEFRRLVGRDPSHLDSHQHAHTRDPLRSVIVGLATALRVPVRHLSPSVSYCGEFYGQTAEGDPLPGRLEPAALAGTIGALSGDSVELCCHPAAVVDFPGAYTAERLEELETLCSPIVRTAIDDAGFVLGTFRDVDRGPGPTSRSRPPHTVADPADQ